MSDPQFPQRKSIRFPDYDYSQYGMYFVTICTKNRKHLFGEIVDGEMRCNELGKIVEKIWDDLPHHYPHIQLDEFVVMPNHVHEIVIIYDTLAVVRGRAVKMIFHPKNHFHPPLRGMGCLKLFGL